MKEEQHFAMRRLSADVYPSAATGRRDEGSCPPLARDLERPVPAAAINDDHLVGRPLATDRVEQMRERTLFVQGRNDYRDHWSFPEPQKFILLNAGKRLAHIRELER
jgi:hypothetical protein